MRFENAPHSEVRVGAAGDLHSLDWAVLSLDNPSSSSTQAFVYMTVTTTLL